ncbi:helix-turn-helix domain-containing protein, partial [Sutterella sp.]|uniref:helix-turn-helix domain-containing protein n=1 Tax=Sutterella sp. TaxID=1981025 RepID=UPI0026E0CFBF
SSSASSSAPAGAPVLKHASRLQLPGEGELWPAEILADPTGDRVREAFRARLGQFVTRTALTPAETCDRMGLEPRELMRMLDGQLLPSPAQLVNMAAVLGKSPSGLLWGRAARLTRSDAARWFTTASQGNDDPAVSAIPPADPSDPAARRAFAWRLLVRMADCGVSQAELLARTGISPVTLSSWLAGDAMPRRPKVAQLATVLRTTADHLLLGGPAGTAAALEEARRAEAKGFGDRVAQVLRARVVSTGELAELMGNKRTMLDRRLTGDISPSADFAEKIGAVLDVDPAWLLRGGSEGAPAVLPPEPDPKAFRERFRALVERRGLGFKEFARLLGTSVSTVTRWAGGLGVISVPATARTAAAILGVSPAFLLHGVETGDWKCPIPVVLERAAEEWLRTREAGTTE